MRRAQQRVKANQASTTPNKVKKPNVLNTLKSAMRNLFTNN